MGISKLAQFIYLSLAMLALGACAPEKILQEVKLAPTILPTSSQTTGEGSLLTFDVETLDGNDSNPDGLAVYYTCEYDTTVDGSVNSGLACLSLGVSFNMVNGVFSWTPSYSDGNNDPDIYEFKITAVLEDQTDSDIFTISVTNTDAPPVLDSITNVTVAENAAMTTVDAGDSGDDADSDGDLISYDCFYDITVDAAVAQVTNCTVLGMTVNAATGEIDWTPSYSDAGVYEVVVVADEGDLTDTTIFTITVSATNRAPTIDVALVDMAGETELVPIATAAVTSSDLDGDTISYTCKFDTTVDAVVSSSAANCSTLTSYITTTFDTTTGELDWTPSYAAASGGPQDYEIMITASDGTASDTDIFVITVADVDAPPILITIADETIAENTAMTQINAADSVGGDDDIDGDSITFDCTYDTVPTSGGPFDCEMGGTPLPGASVAFDTSTGILDWTTDYTSASGGADVVYEITIDAASTGGTDSEIFQITVTNDNRLPVLQVTPAIATTSNEADVLSYDFDDTDLVSDGDPDTDIDTDTLTYSCYFDTNPLDDTVVETALNECDDDLDGGVAVFNTATGVLDWTPSYTAAGATSTNYEFKIVANDGVDTDDMIFDIEVVNVNRSPALDAIGDEVVNEQVAITAVNTADGADDFDIDSEALTYSCQFDNINDGSIVAGSSCTLLPGTISFSTSTGALTWTPDYSAGALTSVDYEIEITGTDGSLSDAEIFVITVNHVNAPPVLDAVSDQTVNEMVAITSIDVEDSVGGDNDFDGTALTFTCTFDTVDDDDVPAGSDCGTLLPGTPSFNTGTGVLTWTPSYLAGTVTYEILIEATDGTLTDEVFFEITVTNVDAAPSLTTIADQAFDEGAVISIDADDGGDDFDIDNDALTYSCYYDLVSDAFVASTTSCNSLTGASFNTSTGVLTWTPSSTQGNGNPTYEFKILASEGNLTDDEIFVLTINDIATYGMKKIAAGSNHACGIMPTGALYCWGGNTISLGDTVPTLSSVTPIAADMTNITANVSLVDVASYGTNTCVLDSQGEVYCMGDNAFGQLGDGNLGVDSNILVASTQGALAFKQISVGANHVCAIDNLGDVYCWGDDSSDQLGSGAGDGTCDDISTCNAASVAVALPLKMVAAGTNHSCVIAASGLVYCAGDNTSGQLGDNSTTDRNSFVAVNSTLKFKKIGAGNAFTCGLTDTSLIYCWGVAIQNGQSTNVTSPTAISTTMLSGIKFKDLYVGENNACALSENGTPYCWGENSNDQIGDGSGTDEASATLVDTSSYPLDTRYAQLAVGANYVCATGKDAGVYCWGNNSVMPVSDIPEALDLSSISEYQDDVLYLTQLSVGAEYACGLLGNGDAACWGNGLSYQFGNNSSSLKDRPAFVTTGSEDYVKIAAGTSHTCALTIKGDVYCFGDNTFGQIGNGSTTTAKTPQKVSASTNLFIDVAVGSSHSCALTSAGKVYCWGANTQGQLGDNSTTNRTTPVLVSGSQVFIQISLGVSHSCGITSSSAVYCWGYNNYYQLGDGTTTRSLVPVAFNVGSEYYSHISAGGSSTCGVTLDSKLYCLGKNSSGQLMIGSTSTATTPTFISSGAQNTNIGRYHSIGIGSNAFVANSGLNSFGQLGNNSTTDSTTLVLTDLSALVPAPYFISAAVGDYYTCALSDAGQVYCYGDNSKYQIGDDTNTASYDTPQALFQTSLPTY